MAELCWGMKLPLKLKIYLSCSFIQRRSAAAQPPLREQNKEITVAFTQCPLLYFRSLLSLLSPQTMLKSPFCTHKNKEAQLAHRPLGVVQTTLLLSVCHSLLSFSDGNFSPE